MKTIEEIKNNCRPIFDEIDKSALTNQKKVLKAFQDNQIALYNMVPSNGYGHDDIGKYKLNELFASVFHTEDAVVSNYFTCGTHTLSTTLLAVLLPGDTIFSLTGDPYDALETTFFGTNVGSLKDYNIRFNKQEIVNGEIDYDSIESNIKKYNPTMVYLQRSAGYSTRETLSIAKLEKAISIVKKVSPNAIIFIDNCYGTFCEDREPSDVGADLVVGSLIKNAGGGIAPNGGYVVGKKKLIEKVAYRLFGIGIGIDVCTNPFGYNYYFEGLFLAPMIVSNALKGSVLIGATLDELGIKSYPRAYKRPNDHVRCIEFNDKDKMANFVAIVQSTCAVDSFVTPVAAKNEGYADELIMASGSFVQGSTIELSCDGPVRPPYIAYMQGGLTIYQHEILAEKLLKVYSK